MRLAMFVLAGVAVVCIAGGAVIEVGSVEGNATPAVRAAVERLRDGDTLRFAKGEYHFFEEGAKEHFLASVGSSTGMKKVVVHLEGLKDVTIDGGGSSFVFHGNTFPFVAERCDGLKICNFTSRVFQLPLVEFTIAEKKDEGFLCQFAKGSAPYETKDGEIFFDMDEGRTDSFSADFGGGVWLTGAFSQAGLVDKKGQYQPEYQGWLPIHTGDEHEHRAIHTPTLCGTFTGERRLVTVFMPSRGTSVRLAGVRAAADAAAKDYTLLLSDGSAYTFSEP